MARPFKQGLEYFPFDVTFFDDEKIQEILVEYGYLSVVIYIRILTLIYKNGYFLEQTVEVLSKRLFKEFHSRWLTKVERIQEIIYRIAELGLLEQTLVAKGIITSASIQKQWLISTRKRKQVDKEKYWLLDRHDEAKLKIFFDTCDDATASQTLVNDASNEVNGVINKVKSVSNTQKEKKKEKDKLDKYDKRKSDIYGVPKLHFLTKVLIQNDYINDVDMNILKYNKLFEEMVSEYGFDMVLSATNYIIKYVNNTSNTVDDKYDFFKASIINNCDRLDYLNERGEVNYEEEIRKLFKKLDNKN